jgi:oligopeptide transport system substrate-binding protein
MPAGKRWRSTLAAALAAVFVCSLSLHAAPGVAQARAHSANSDTIFVDYISDFSSLDTGKCYDTQCYPWAHAMFDQLMQYDTRHGTGDNLIPDAAAAMPTITNGGKTYIFRLRHDVHFWNGRLATSADWIYSFERIINPTTQAGAAAFWQAIVGAKQYAAGKAKHVTGIKALGPWGLEIDLEAPEAFFLNVLAMPFGSVVDKNQIEKYGKSYATQHIMGTGPYMFQEYKLGQRLVLVKNPHYFDPAHAGHVARLEADIGVSTETSFLRVQRGQADLDGDFPTPIPPAEFLNILSDPVLSKRVVKEVQVATEYVALNTLIKPFDNVLARRAVEYAIDKQRIVRLINGRGKVATTFIPPTMPGYGYFNMYPYNPARAKQLLAQAGFPNGFSTTLYSDNAADDPRVAQAIVPMLAAIGIKAKLRVLELNTFITAVGTKGKVPISWVAWYMDFPDPNDFFEPIESCASASPGTFNEAWYCNPKLDALMYKLKSMTDRRARLKLYPQLDRMLLRDAPVVPVYNPVYYILPSAQLHNFYLHNVWTLVLADYTKS